MNLFRIWYCVDNIIRIDVISVYDLDDNVLSFILESKFSQGIAQLTVNDGLIAETFNVGNDELEARAFLAQGYMLRTDTESNGLVAIEVFFVNLRHR